MEGSSCEISSDDEEHSPSHRLQKNDGEHTPGHWHQSFSEFVGNVDNWHQFSSDDETSSWQSSSDEEMSSWQSSSDDEMSSDQASDDDEEFIMDDESQQI